jgi:hypothetical protein
MRKGLVLLLGMAAALSACGNTTGGALIQLPFSLGGVDRADAGSLSFTSATGWAVTLDDGLVALGPFYFNVSPSQTGAVEGGLVIVQVTSQAVVNVLDSTLYGVDGGADGQTGAAVAVDIGLLPPDATQAVVIEEQLGTGEAYVRGTALKGTTAVPFAGMAEVDLRLATPQNPPAVLQRINGASLDLTFAPKGQQLLLRVDPSTWFDTADFGQLLQGTPDPVTGNYGWDISSSFNQALLSGIKQTSGVYDFELLGN